MSSTWTLIEDGFPEMDKQVVVCVATSTGRKYYEDRHNGYVWTYVIDKDVISWCDLPKERKDLRQEHKDLEKRVEANESRMRFIETQMHRYGVYRSKEDYK